MSHCAALIRNNIVLVSRFMRRLEVRVASRQMSLRDLFKLFAPNMKWVPHMIHGVARPKGLVLKQSHIISLPY